MAALCPYLSGCVRRVLERDQRRPTEDVLSHRLQGRHFCALGGQRPHARVDNDDHRGHRDLLRLSSRRCGATRTAANSLSSTRPLALAQPCRTGRSVLALGSTAHSGRGLWAAPSPNLGAAACRQRGFGQAKVDGSFVAFRRQAEGYVLSGWSSTTRMTHALTDSGELKVVTVTAQGEYAMWMTRKPGALNQSPITPSSLHPTEKKDGLIGRLGQRVRVLVSSNCCRCVSKGEERPTTADPHAIDQLAPAPHAPDGLRWLELSCCAARGGRTHPRQIAVGRRGRRVPLDPPPARV